MAPGAGAEGGAEAVGASAADDSADGARAPVRALFAPPQGDRSVVVFFHGNGSDLAGNEWLAAQLMQTGLGVLFVEYPGYGVAGGSPSEAAIYAAAERALEELAARGIERERTVLVGQSLGTAVAAEMAARGWGARLMMISPFTSIPDLVDGMIPFGIGGVFATDRFDTLGKARRLGGLMERGVVERVVVVHGDADWFVPMAMGEEIVERVGAGAGAAGRAEMVVLEGAGHNDVFEHEGDRLVRLIVAFAGREALP